MDPLQALVDILMSIWNTIQSVLAMGISSLASILPSQFPYIGQLVALLDLRPFFSFLVIIAHWFPLWALAWAFQLWLAVEIVMLSWWLYRIVRLALI